MLKTSIQTTKIFEMFGIDEGFRVIREAGFDGVDFTLIPFVPQSAIRRETSCIFERSDDEILSYFEPYRAAAEKYGIEFCQAHAPMQSHQKTKVSCEYMFLMLEKSLMLCRHLNCPYLVVHPFFFGYDDQLEPGYEYELNISGYGRLIPFIRQYGVTVCLENMFMVRRGKVYGAICQNPAETNRYIDTLNDLAGGKCFSFCYDTGHSNLIGRDLRAIINTLGSRIGCLHIHDNNGCEDQHLSPYMGCADWDRFVLGMRDIGYRGVLNFESHGIVSAFPKELVPHALRLTAASGRMFAKRICE